MVAIPKSNNPVEAAIEEKTYPQADRTYLGMSGVGGSCLRKSWYSWRWVKDRTISARVKRIFERGDLEEPRIVADLEAAGMVFSDDQLEVTHSTQHCLGHIDGIVIGVPGAEKTRHLTEFKTMKNASFNALKKKAALLNSFWLALLATNATYAGQVQLYMGYLDLTRCLYVVTNKDNEERIYARIKFEPQIFEQLKDRASDIIFSETPPPRVSDRSDFFECKWCDFRDICFNGAASKKNCRTCKYADIHDGGIWKCSLIHEELSKGSQVQGCSKHEYIQGLN